MTNQNQSNKRKLDEEKPWKYSVVVPLTTERHATIVYKSLLPDKEPRPTQVEREMSVQGSTLVCKWSTSTPQLLRVVVDAFYQNVILIVNTMIQFDTLEETN